MGQQNNTNEQIPLAPQEEIQARPLNIQFLKKPPLNPQPSQPQPLQAQPIQQQPLQAQPIQQQPLQAQPIQQQPLQAKPIQQQPLQAKPIQQQPLQAQPMQGQSYAQPMQAQPMQGQSYAQPMQAQPLPSQPYGQPLQPQPYAQPMQGQPYGQPQQVFVQNVVLPPPKSRVAYILLAFFLGGFGIHNFYAGYVGKGLAQLLLNWFVFWPLGWGLCFLILPLALLFVVPIWNIIEMIVVDRDASGQLMV